MKREYDMTGARRATEVDHLNRLRAGKTRITIMLDDDVLAAFRSQAETQGLGYQTLINQTLRNCLGEKPLDEETLRRVLREELNAV